MDHSAIINALPVTPRPEMEEYARLVLKENNGGHLMVYHREPWNRYTDDTYCGWPEYDIEPENHWAAACRCSNCGYTWYTGWVKGGRASRSSSGMTEICTAAFRPKSLCGKWTTESAGT